MAKINKVSLSSENSGMKTATVNYLIIAAVAFMSVAFTSCKSKGSAQKEWLITDHGVGIFIVGQPIPFDALNYTVTSGVGALDKPFYLFSRTGENIVEIIPGVDSETWEYTKTIGTINVLSERLKTAEGIGVGSTIEDFVSAYPNFRLWFNIEGMFVIETDQYSVQFILDEADFTGDGKAYREINIIDLSDFKEGAKIKSVRIYMADPYFPAEPVNDANDDYYLGKYVLTGTQWGINYSNSYIELLAGGKYKHSINMCEGWDLYEGTFSIVGNTLTLTRNKENFTLSLKISGEKITFTHDDFFDCTGETTYIKTEISVEEISESDFYVKETDWQGVKCELIYVLEGSPQRTVNASQYIANDTDYIISSNQECIFPNANFQQVYDVVRKMSSELSDEIPSNDIVFSYYDDSVTVTYEYKSEKHLFIEFLWVESGGGFSVEIIEQENETKSIITTFVP